MTIAARTFPDYASALRPAYEEEISGEAYYIGLAERFLGRPRDALLMIARMERVTARALRTLILRHSIRTADDATLIARGKATATKHKHIAWHGLTRRMAEEYPVYLEEFSQLVRLAPKEDQASIAIAMEHEHVLIEFGRREVAGDPWSLAPVEQFLARYGGA